MRELWACSYAVSGFERKVLIRRAGLDGFSPASYTAVARHLRVSVKRIRRAQRRGMRRLRTANRSDGCAMSSPPAAVEQTVGALRAVATAPALVTPERATRADAHAAPASERGGQGAVLGERRSSTPVHIERPQIAGTLPAAGGDDGSGPWVLILLLALMAIAASTPLVLRRGRQSSPPPQALPDPPAPPPPSPAIPPPPWTEPEQGAPKRDVHHGQRRS